jgi:exopolysaccharide biosynthesis polyprenyl glycosylphosphotransferase
MLMVAAGSIMGGTHPVGLALRLWLFAAVYLSVARIVLASVRTQARRNYALATPTLILGSGIVAERLVKRLTSDRGYGLRPVGLLDSDPVGTFEYAASAIPVLGGPDDLGEAIRQTGARHLILAFSSEPDHVLVEKVRECEQLGIQVSLVPRMFEALNDRAVLNHLGGLPLISLRPTDPHGWQFAVKHAGDRGIALVGLVALAPVLGAIALAVRLSSPGPALFRQRRVGRDGRAFDVLKFRTMREPDPGFLDDFVPPEGCAPGGIEGEDRTTPLGRWLRRSSLDEVPQLINVLRGEMSIVGPRPERPQFAAHFAAEVHGYDDRLRVKSGITGWAQVNGLRGQTSIADRVEWDNYYIRNWSLGLDFKIMMLTVAEVLRLRDSQKARDRAADSGIRTG